MVFFIFHAYMSLPPRKGLFHEIYNLMRFSKIIKSELLLFFLGSVVSNIYPGVGALLLSAVH